MPIVGQGGTAPLDATFVNGASQPSEATDVTLTVRDPIGAIVTGFPVVVPPIVDTGLGTYSYDWVVSPTADLGEYTATWTGDVNGAPVQGSETWQVVAAGTVLFGGLLQILDSVGGDFDAIRAMLGVEAIDVSDDIIGLPAFGPYAEARIMEIVPDWATIIADAGAPAAHLRAAVRYATAAMLAESYVKGGTVSLVHEELPRRNWSEWARIFWNRYEEALARVVTSGVPDDDFDVPSQIVTGPSRRRGRRPDWTGDYPPVWPELPS